MFSLIFQGFDGASYRDNTRADAFRAAFGETGCYRSLSSDSKKYAPCELAANLPKEAAQSKAALLREAHVRVDIVPTEAVADVKHRAFECWPTHRAPNGETFTECGPVVVRGVSLDLKARMQAWRDDTVLPFWRFELECNHDHPTNTLNRYGLRMARERGAELGAALTECFPERRFLVVYRDEQISFCQFNESTEFTAELPLGISSENRRIVDLRVSQGQEAQNEVCFCEVCERRTPYSIASRPDPEFPNAQWADCTVCGNEVVLWADQEAILASDAARRNAPTPCYVPGSTGENTPLSFANLKAAIGDSLHPSAAWMEAASRLWLGREPGAPGSKPFALARTLLQIEAITALLLDYRVWQLSLPSEKQDQSQLTPERLGIPKSSPLYHPARRALAPVTVVTSIEEKTTSHALLNGTNERYMAGRRIEPNRAVYEGRFWYGLRDTRGRTFWRAGLNGKTYRVVNDVAPHVAEPRTCAPYGVATSLTFIREQSIERCIAFSVLLDESKRVIAQHRRLFCRFYELDIEPNPTITIEQNEGMLTLRSDVFVWGLFLGWHHSATLSDNAFDLLPGIPYSLPWDEAVSGRPKIRHTGNSLFV